MSIIDCLLSNSAMAAGIGLLAVLVDRLARKPYLTHALWVLVLVKLITPPFVHIPVGYPGAEPLEAVAAADSARSHAGVSPARPSGGVPIVHHESGEFTQPSRVSPVVSGPRMETHVRKGAAPAFAVPWVTLLIYTWIAGSLIWFLLAGIRLYGFNRLLRSAQPASKGLQAEIHSVARRYGLRRLPRVLVVDVNLPPLIFSFGWQNSMVLPRSLLDSLGADERVGLLAHEMAHLKRHDDWIRWLEFVVLGVHWWNPIAWWARKHIQQAEEECCDAWVVWAFPNTASLYAQTVVTTVDFLAGSSRLKPGAATAFTQGYSLKRRVEMILSERTSRRMSWGGRTILVLLAAIVVPLSLLGASNDQSERKALNQEEESAWRGESGAESASVEEVQGVQDASEERRTLPGRVVAPDGQPVTAEAPYRTLYAEWKADRQALNNSKTSGEKGKEQLADLSARYTRLFVELAKQHASDDETWVSCLMWVGQHGMPGDDFDAMIDLMRQHAGGLQEPLQLRLFLSFLIRSQSVRLNPALRDLSENHPSKGIRGAALYVLAARMKIAAEEAGSIEECAEAESLLRRVVAEYPDATTYLGKNEDNAKALLDELHSPVAIGKTAPETVGNDLDGVEFNLGSMRGKVVVLSFSGHWCTPCRAMHPIQKKLLQKFASDEFAVVEINSDNKKNKKKVAEKMRLDGLRWHVVLDGSRGPISKQWHVSAWPTFCVLDRDHKIRRRGAGYLGVKLEDWVGELIGEQPED